MTDQNVGFRNTLFGGFKREDVLLYIEKMDCTYAEETARLEKRAQNAGSSLADLKAQNREYADKNNQLLAEIETMTKDMDAIRAQMDEIEKNFATQEAEHNSQQEKLSQLMEDKEIFREENERLRKKCGEYDAAKDKLAEMELSAYRRAKKIEQDAREEARRVQAQSRELLAKVRRQLDETSEAYKHALAKSQAESEAMTRRAKMTLSELDKISGKLGTDQDSNTLREAGNVFQMKKDAK